MILEKFKQVKAFVFDVDGVLTNGQILITEGGELLRSMNIKDGYAMKKAQQEGFPVVIISGGFSEGVRTRLLRLGLEEVYIGVDDKPNVLLKSLSSLNLKVEDCLIMGDDMPDLEILKAAGCSTCPADAVLDIQDICDYISPINGGNGCVRDVIERVLKIQSRW